jgi:hypothetical protein
MKAFLACLVSVVVFRAVPVSAAPDYASLNQAVTNYFAALDGVAKQFSTVDTAAGTAELIGAWALANEIFSNAGERFAADNPELFTQAQPPPEFAAAYGRLSRLKTDYAALPANVGALVARFQDDPGVAKAFERFKKSLIRVQHAGALRKKSPPADAGQPGQPRP